METKKQIDSFKVLASLAGFIILSFLGLLLYCKHLLETAVRP